MNKRIEYVERPEQGLCPLTFFRITQLTNELESTSTSLTVPISGPVSSFCMLMRTVLRAMKALRSIRIESSEEQISF